MTIQSIDGPNRRIYLDATTVGAEVNPVEIYRDMRALRRTDENLRKYNIFMKMDGNIAKGGGKFTERYATLLEGTRIIPFDTTHQITITGTLITDDGQEGVACFDRTPLSPTSTVDINYVPPQVEVIVVSGSGGATLDEIVDAVWDEPAADHNTVGTMGEKQNSSNVDIAAIALAVEAQLVDDFAGITVDNGAIAAAVEAVLLDNFAAIPAAVQTQLASDFAAIPVEVDSQLTDNFASITVDNNAIAAAVWSTNISGYITAGQAGNYLSTRPDSANIAASVQIILNDDFAAIPGAVQTQLATDFASIPTDVDSQLAASFTAIPGDVATALAADFAAIPAAVDTQLLDNFAALPTAADIRTEIDNNSTSLSTLLSVSDDIWKANFHKRFWNSTAQKLYIYEANGTTVFKEFDTDATLSTITPV